jgi:hypothetical protein
MKQFWLTVALTAAACSVVGLHGTAAAQFKPPTIDQSAVEKDAEVKFNFDHDGFVQVEWPAGDGGFARAVFCLDTARPLIESFQWRRNQDAEPKIIARELRPFTALTVGSRNLTRPGGWMVFFDKVHERPYERHSVDLAIHSVRAKTRGSRGTLEIGDVRAGPFPGERPRHFV